LHEKSEHNVKGCPCEQEKHSTHHRHATVLTTGVKLGQLGDHEYSLEPEEDEGWGQGRDDRRKPSRRAPQSEKEKNSKQLRKDDEGSQ